MALHRKTQALIEAAAAALGSQPMTVRQVFYQLVSGHVIKNTQAEYKRVSRALVDARCRGTIPWEWIEDRLRRPRRVSMWKGLDDFTETAIVAYRRDVWATQPVYLEVWVEKDALSGIFEEILSRYGVTLNVGRGYDGWDSIRNAAGRFSVYDRRSRDVLYFGDFDPSGEDMVRSLGKRLAHFGCDATITKCAITPDDIDRYSLPPDPTKSTDTRSAAFVARHGDVAVELDALPVDVLGERIESEVSSRMDLRALKRVQRAEQKDRTRLEELLRGAA